MNAQNKKQIIVAAILGAVFVGVLGYQIFIAGGHTPPPGVKPPAPAASGTTPVAKQTAADVSAPVEEINLKELIASVSVKPIDYAQVRVARNPMAPLVGQIQLRRGEIEAGGVGEIGEEEREVFIQMYIDTTASKQINGIVWDSRYPVAIVDDVVVHIGYEFPNGARVLDIEPARVLFQVGDAVVPVEMKEY